MPLSQFVPYLRGTQYNGSNSDPDTQTGPGGPRPFRGLLLFPFIPTEGLMTAYRKPCQGRYAQSPACA